MSDAVGIHQKETVKPDIIGFFHEDEEYGCFSNWYPAPFDYAGMHYANSEQFMMYHKVLMFERFDLADKIMETSDPGKCKKIAGQIFPEFVPELWEKTCRTVLYRIQLTCWSMVILMLEFLICAIVYTIFSEKAPDTLAIVFRKNIGEKAMPRRGLS